VDFAARFRPSYSEKVTIFTLLASTDWPQRRKLSGFQPYHFEPPHADCHGLKSFSIVAFTVSSILMSGRPGAFEAFAGQFFRPRNLRPRSRPCAGEAIGTGCPRHFFLDA
jgi:hypothetical protein